MNQVFKAINNKLEEMEKKISPKRTQLSDAMDELNRLQKVQDELEYDLMVQFDGNDGEVSGAYKRVILNYKNLIKRQLQIIEQLSKQ